MIRKLYTLLMIGFCMSFLACSDDNDENGLDSAVPVINLPIKDLNIDLNKVDNLPVVAIIKSEVGLQKVTMQIQNIDDSVVDYKTITEFFNPKVYSLSETPEYSNNLKSVIIKAEDQLGREETATINVLITDVVARPSVDFSVDEIVYDEMDENPQMPKTQFVVSSEAGLSRVELYLVSEKGQVSQGSVELNGADKYEYNELINYVEGDKGFKVKAEDTYGNITISTLPVKYKVVPLPEVAITKAGPISVDSNVDVEIPVNVKSIRGVKNLKIYGVEPEAENLLMDVPCNGENDLKASYKVKLNNNTLKVKVVASDGREGKEVAADIVTYVDMTVATVQIGSQFIANNPSPKYPDVYGLLSLKDMKTYSVDYALQSDENAKNIDFIFYCFGGQGVPRLYGMNNTEKFGEFKGNTGSLKDITVKNATAFNKRDGVDFDKVTVKYIKDNIPASVVSSSRLNDIEAGQIIAFRTGNSSHFGGGKIGLMKVVSITAVKEIDPSNATKRVMTLEFRFPKYPLK